MDETYVYQTNNIQFSAIEISQTSVNIDTDYSADQLNKIK